MKTKRLLMLIGSVCLTLVLAVPVAVSCAGPATTPTTTSTEAMKLVACTASAASDVQMGQSLIAFTEEVEKRTDGRIYFDDVITGGALLGWGELIPGLTKGVADVTILVIGYEPGIFHAHTSFSGLLDLDTGCYQTTRGVSCLERKMFQEFPEFNAEFTAANMKYLYPVPSTEYVFCTSEPVKNVADFEGRKIRTSSEGVGKLVEAGGGVMILAPASEVYTGIATGVMDGAASTAPYFVSAKWTEVAPYILVPAPVSGPVILFSNDPIAMNLDTWNKISPQDQEIILEISHEQSFIFADLMAASHDETMALWEKDPEVHVTYLSEEERQKWIEASPDWYARIAEDLDAAGLPGTAMAERVYELLIDFNTGKWEAEKEYLEATK